MKKLNGFRLSIPYIQVNEDGSTDRAWAHMSSQETVNRRWIKKALRKWVRQTLGRSLHPEEQYMLMKRIKEY